MPSLLYSLLLLGFMFDRLVPEGHLVPSLGALPKGGTEDLAPGAAVPSAPNASSAQQEEPFAAVAKREGAARWMVAAVLVTFMAAFFTYFAPLMYGTPLSTTALKARFWATGWE